MQTPTDILSVCNFARKGALIALSTQHSLSGLPYANQIWLKPPIKRVFCVPKSVSGRKDARSWVDQDVNVCLPRPLVKFFLAANRPLLLHSFRLGLGHGHADDGGARSRRMAARMASTIRPVTATSANWKIMTRTTLDASSGLDQLQLQTGQRPVDHCQWQFDAV